METSQLNCCANQQLTSFYMRATLALNGLTGKIDYFHIVFPMRMAKLEVLLETFSLIAALSRLGN